MADVWTARDTVLDREVIVKVGPAGMDADLLRRFTREALLTARLIHPGVPTIHDFDMHDGRPYLILEKINGPTLADLTAEVDPVPIGWVYAIGAQIAAVLIAAERHNLVHRDLKPANVMLERSGAVKVLDFGLATIHDDARYSRITRSDQSLGTVGYMAPEQVLGEPIDHRTDLYGLGGILYHLLARRAPFDAGSTLATVRHQLSQAPPRPAALRPDTPAELDALIGALLAERPEDRPSSALDVYDALAPHAVDLPPLPGVVTEGADPVRAYAAVVGRHPTRLPDAPIPHARTTEPDDESTVATAERLEAGGAYRAAVRTWRRLATAHEGEHGPAHAAAVDCWIRAAGAHVLLGEHERAVRLLDGLSQRQLGVVGADHASLLQVQAELQRLQAHRGGPG
ncbi:serine/threonine-protein kinase [Dactylosporangium sp. NPDC049140]|uniref:serine/threonine-protein kinase n=1 Tax=Dactylosporangium sp. NPDC049140 TaxID=3155647 RepID=UPI0033E9383E